MKTIRTETRDVIEERNVTSLPKYKVGDYMEVYCGSYQGHCFYIKDVRFNLDKNNFEYLYDGILMGGWYSQNSIVPA